MNALRLQWILRFIGGGMSSVWFWGLLFCALDLRGYYVWKRRRDSGPEGSVDPRDAVPATSHLRCEECGREG